MDYYEIGQRIRYYRKARGYSQEELAEMVGISVTHMSHIETANTKLSLQVLVDISDKLSVTTDTLIFGKPEQKRISEELLQAIKSCDEGQGKIIAELINHMLIVMNKYEIKEKN